MEAGGLQRLASDKPPGPDLNRLPGPEAYLRLVDVETSAALGQAAVSFLFFLLRRGGGRGQAPNPGSRAARRKKTRSTSARGSELTYPKWESHSPKAEPDGAPGSRLGAD